MLSNNIMHGFMLYDFVSRTLLLHRINYKMAWEEFSFDYALTEIYSSWFFSNKKWLCWDFFCVIVINMISILSYIRFWKFCFLLHGTAEFFFSMYAYGNFYDNLSFLVHTRMWKVIYALHHLLLGQSSRLNSWKSC